jgi:energy-coupling factor transporter ATP-binding protein EcfA2
MPLSADTLVARVRVPRASSTRDITALETAMQSLTLHERYPVALEIAGTATSRAWLLRATTPAALRHLVAQIQARYPQAEIDTPEDDPLTLQAGEVASVVELTPGAASYLPLRTLAEQELFKEGTDPLLGVLAAFDQLPPNTRAIAHLALLPLPASWSRAYRRRAVEHPLEQEHVRQQASLHQSEAATPSPAKLVGLLLLVAVLLLWWRFQKTILAHTPAWLLRAGNQVLHGQTPQFTSGEVAQLMGGGIGLFLVFFALAFLILWVRNRFGQPAIYDMRLVDEKTARLAYRVRLRLIVIAPALAQMPLPPDAHHSMRRRLSQVHTLLLLPPGDVWRALRAGRQQRRQAQQSTRAGRQQRQDVLDVLVAAYRQYHTASGGSFVPRRLSGRNTRRVLASVRLPGWTTDVARSRHLLSVADLATLWHLPQAQDLADLKYVPRGRARTLLVPAQLTTGQGYPLGTSSHAGEHAPVFLPATCLRQNLLAVASTGKGKSTLFHHLARAAMQDAGRCVIVVEPHGDLIAHLLGSIPPSRQDDVVLIDLASLDFPVGINPLDMSLGRSRDKTADNLGQIGEARWQPSWGPRTANVFRMSLNTLAEANEYLIQNDPQGGRARQYTLLDILPLLERSSFRHAVLEQIHDPVVLDWWAFYYESKDRRMQEEITSSLITKLSQLASSYVTRNILGQPQTTVNFQEAIREGKILLISTASGIVGAETSALVGAILLGLLHTTLAEQAHDPQEQRRSVLMLIDEFQAYGGVNYQSMLAELRKYGGSFAMATQSLSYLDSFDRTLRSTVLANIDHLFAFTMAAEDARLLHLDGVEEADITSLDDYQCYARLSLGGQRLPLFSLNLATPPSPDEARARTIRLASQQRDARPVGEVETMLREAQARQRSATPTRPVFAEVPDPAKPQTAKTGSTSQRKKKRGNGGKQTAEPALAPTPQVHLMYDEEHTNAREDQDEQER